MTTISVALRRVAALKGDIARLESRRPQSILYRKDSLPAWKLADLEAQIDAARKELIDLKVRLAVANATNTVEVPGEGERTLISCIVEMQEVKGQITTLENLMGYTKAQPSFLEKDRNYNDDGKIVTVETPMVCDLTTQVLDERVKALRERFSLLNAIVEAANHTTEA